MNHFGLIKLLDKFCFAYKSVKRCCVMVITTTKRHSTKLVLRFAKFSKLDIGILQEKYSERYKFNHKDNENIKLF